MKSRAAKLLATLACSLTVWAASAAPTQAGTPWMWNSMFGPVGQGYGSYYGPTYYGAMYGVGYRRYGRCCGGSQAFYAPVVTYGGYSSYGSCAPACGPVCASACAPCGSPCGNVSSGCDLACGSSCASNDCSVGGQPGTPLAPVPDNRNLNQPGPAPGPGPGATGRPPVTYGEEPAPGNFTPPVAPGAVPLAPSGPPRPPASPGSLLPDDEPLPSRTVPAPGFGPTKKPAAGSSNATDSTGAFKPPVTTTPSTTTEPKKNAVPPPKISDDKDDDKDARHGPVLNLDEKVTWRPTPERRRLAVRPIYANARLLRGAAYPESEWIPVNGDSKLAKK